MKTFLNIIWYFPFFGFLTAIPMAVIGVLWCLTIVGIPIGLGLFQIALFLLMPNTHSLVSKKKVNEYTGKKQNTAWVVFSWIVRVLYFPIGLMVAAAYIIIAIIYFLSIIGIPCGLVIVKMIGALFDPVNKVCVRDYAADRFSEAREQKKFDAKYGNNNSAHQGQPAGSYPNNAGSGYYPAEFQNAPQSSNHLNVRIYDDAKLREVVENPMLHTPKLIEECQKEIQIREHSREVMPYAEGCSNERLQEIINSPDEYSAELVYCAGVVLESRSKAMAEENARIAEENARAEQEENERRKQETIDFFMKWKYVIIGSVVAILAISISLWLTSDSHRFNKAMDAFNKGDYKTAVAYAYKIDNTKSKYYDYALAVANEAVNMEKNLDDEMAEKAKKITHRIDKIMERDNAVVTNPFFTRYYCRYIFASIPDSCVAPYGKIAKVMSGSEETMYTAGVAYYLDGQYDKANEIFQHLASQQGNESALAYMGVMNIFGLCSNYSREKGWNYIDMAPAEGAIAMLKGDKALHYDGRYRGRVEDALRYYRVADIGNMEDYFPNILNIRRHIAEECYENSRYPQDYSFNTGKYYGQVGVYGSIWGANGWGNFKYKDGAVEYGKYKFSSGKISCVDANLYLWATNNNDLQSRVIDYDNDEEYQINALGHITKITKYGVQAYYPFNPKWFMLKDSYFHASFDPEHHTAWVDGDTEFF